MECNNCGREIKKVLVTHEYEITSERKDGRWVKSYGEARYTCSECLQELDSRDIEDILKQVDEL